jgi:hypothetical protein
MISLFLFRHILKIFPCYFYHINEFVYYTLQPGHSIRTFTGSTAAMSIDFHPSKDDLIRYWSIGKGSLVGVYKVRNLYCEADPNVLL